MKFVILRLLTHSELKPTCSPMYSGGATPVQFNSGYDDRAAFVWPGVSISGTTVMYRACA